MNYIKILYKKSGCKSVREFSELTGISSRTLDSYIYENREVKLTVFIKICESLGVDFNKWFTGLLIKKRV